MNKNFILILLFAIILVPGCGEKEEIPAGMHKIEVMESMNASNYTYMRVDENGEEYWIAVPQQPVNKGDIFYFSKSLEMKNFSSSTLNRTFDRILFVEDMRKSMVQQNPGMGGMNPHSQVMSGKRDVKVDHLSDGQTVEQIYKNKDNFSGKEIKLRGIVIKYNSGIKDRNRIHIQDGTSFDNNFDLIVTSTDETEEGKTIIVTGTVSLNKDYGNGYAYDVLVENASIKTE